MVLDLNIGEHLFRSLPELGSDLLGQVVIVTEMAHPCVGLGAASVRSIAKGLEIRSLIRSMAERGQLLICSS